MKRVELDHWFVIDNMLAISVMRYHVEIRVYQDDIIIYKLRVVNSKKKSLIFDFYSLEDAITFTERVISKSKTLEDIKEVYNDSFENSKSKEKVLKRY